MAAKNKRSSSSGAFDASARNPDGRTSFALHSRTSQHRDELLQEARALMTEGRVREARAVEKRAAQAGQLLGALESEIRPASGRPEQTEHEA